MALDNGINEQGDRGARRRARKDFRTSTRPAEGVIPRLVEVKGIGRNTKGRYCPDCGHPTGRCVCHTDEPDVAA